MPSRTYIAIIALASLFSAAGVPINASAAAEGEVDTAAYAELAPEALLPAILAEMRLYLPDIYSVREMRLCPARHIKLKDGRPSDWDVHLEFNAKNQNGGYMGIQRDVAVFRNGRITYPIGNTPQLGRAGFEGLLNKSVDKQMADCPAIPDATVQQALAALK